MNAEKLPLIDLHCHLDGAITVDIAKKLALLQGIELPCKDDDELLQKLSVPETCESLTEYLECFALPVSLLQTKEAVSEAVRLVQEDAKAQGLKYLEIRFAPQLHCTKGLTQEEVVAAALDGLNKSDLKANLILCCMRMESNTSENLETVRLAKKYLVKNNGVVALDLAGAEALFENERFEEEFKLARKLKVPFTIHAGEARGYESVQKALNMGAVRIGHGVRSVYNANLVKYLVKHKIPLEMCPNSNRQTKAFEDMKDYPLREFLNKGIKVTINTDDPAISRTDLKKEFEYIEKMYGITFEDELVIVKNAIDAAFADRKTKKWLKSLIVE